MRIGLTVTWFVLGSFIASSTAWIRNSLRPKIALDCAIGMWGVWGSCKIENKGGAFRQSRTRSLIPAKHGGKPCPNVELKEDRDCSRGAATATLLMSSLASRKTNALKSANIDLNWNEYSMPNLNTNEMVLSHSMPSICPTMSYKGSFMASGGCYSPTHRLKRQLDPLKHRDILIMMDESGSVGPTNFELIKEAATGIIAALRGDAIELAEDRTRVALATFDKENRHYSDFEFDRLMLAEAINKIRYNHQTDGRTCIADALTFAKEKMFIKIRRARSDENTEKMVIMITDGCANCVNIEQLEEVRRSIEPISVVILHIGSIEKCKTRLQALQDGSRCFQLFDVENWETLKDFSSSLLNGTVSWHTWHDFDSKCKVL